MPLQSISDMSCSLNIVKNHNNTYIRDKLNSIEVQSKWITLQKFPLPNKKYIKELDSSITLTVPLVENDELYVFFKYLDDFVENKDLCPNKKHNKFIKQKNGEYFLKVKLYIVSNIFIQGDPKPVPKESIMDFYNYLKEGTEMRFVFNIGKMYEINGEYGFPIYAYRIQLKEPPRNVLTFIEED